MTMDLKSLLFGDEDNLPYFVDDKNNRDDNPYSFDIEGDYAFVAYNLKNAPFSRKPRCDSIFW